MNTEIEKEELKSIDESGYSEKQADLKIDQKQILGQHSKQTMHPKKKQEKKIEGEIVLQNGNGEVVFESDK
ncbi:MAG: hypothetical protein HY430_00200 [Candidatus Levybacteria bacterium]|nr:hypothetical protein [Candidatus Levybacteria bacterium]